MLALGLVIIFVDYQVKDTKLQTTFIIEIHKNLKELTSLLENYVAAHIGQTTFDSSPSIVSMHYKLNHE